ncbi:hypothetical protein TPL01_32840 [Sulfuriferula plumbiphila]|uniref:DUF305 domain-containing protein n=1 Tax=Sulfuriferula plumbiphila TaxID=171865 RepID=A0A512LCD5_9PROT|nr:DUF305 domain-containing protein [Sulfuriferula plumbiphila]BBP02961.1 hypothetical protein SFPGR_03830 [Sulfuriferula plumbiphila]GEP32146.1 hypothetical protein TPL01_32840 [Sulfuriferula plumbiphila]
MSQQRKQDMLKNNRDWKRACITIMALAALATPPWANAQSGPVPADGATRALEPAADTVEGKSATEMQKSIDSLKEKTAAFQVTGNTDFDFAMMARMQRQAELDIAKAELEHGKEPMLRSMANRIIESQKNEIKQLDQWLALFHKFD